MRLLRSAPSEGSAELHNQVPGEPNPELRLTSSGVASHRQLPPRRSPTALLNCATRRLAARSSDLAWPEGQSRPMFRGPSWDVPQPRPALPPTTRKSPSAASRKSKDHLFRRLVPAGPEKPPKEPSTACRGDRTFSHLPHRPLIAKGQRLPTSPNERTDRKRPKPKTKESRQPQCYHRSDGSQSSERLQSDLRPPWPNL
jgi:hypothetical protein